MIDKPIPELSTQMDTLELTNANAPTIRIAEKGADLIKSYWYSHGTKRKRRDLSDWPEKKQR